jgi:tetrapyrrole methylase family protein/MazG family protein
MDEFKQLIAITETLIGPNGCPWDQKQTFESLRSSVHEEVHELIEAIDLGDPEKIIEELGDLFFNAIFFCKVAEKEGKFNTEQVLSLLIEKLIRRHPHVFGDVKIDNLDALYKQWESIKQQEKGKEDRLSELDSIPKGLPSLSRATKMMKKFKKSEYKEEVDKNQRAEEIDHEQKFGQALYKLAKEASAQGIDPENALRKILNQKENQFREWEKKR